MPAWGLWPYKIKDLAGWGQLPKRRAFKVSSSQRGPRLGTIQLTVHPTPKLSTRRTRGSAAINASDAVR